jgi:hypothetical protein
MTITVHSTDQIIQIEKAGVSVPARVWEGKTDSGIAVSLLVTRIAAGKNEDLSQFERELQEQAIPEINCWPLRIIL